jgi:hypothetical protein
VKVEKCATGKYSLRVELLTPFCSVWLLPSKVCRSSDMNFITVATTKTWKMLFCVIRCGSSIRCRRSCILIFPCQTITYISVFSVSFQHCSILIYHFSPSYVEKKSNVPDVNEYNPAFHNSTSVPYTQRAERVLNQHVAEWLISGYNSRLLSQYFLRTDEILWSGS